MNIPEEYVEEVSRLQELGYNVISTSGVSVKLEKRVKPSTLKIIVWTLISICFPLILIFLLLSPAKIYYFFKGQHYLAEVAKDESGEIIVK